MYQTEQRKYLMKFLEENASKQFTIEQIAKDEKISSQIGKSTVYRLMRRLLNEGYIKKYPCKDGRRFLYQYVNADTCQSHLHLKCTSCGKLIHLRDEVSESVTNKIENNNDFEIDTKQTVLFGKCKSCKNGKKKDEK